MKLGDVSNRTLVGLLVVAILVSLVGTFVSLDKLGSLGGVSGAATQSGTASVTISGTAEITLRTNVSVGTVQVNDATPNTGNDNCTIITDLNYTITGDGGSNTFPTDNAETTFSANCLNSSGGTSFSDPGSFVVENTGAVMIDTLNFNFSGGDAAFKSTVGGTQSITQFLVSTDRENVSCTLNSVYDAGNSGPAAAPTTNPSLCTNFYGNNSKDAVALNVIFVIPDDANTVTYQDNVTFTATVT